mmetsp:Transcript_26391/g.60796  ORF Transcript_26391/g.60796 Transcript_26391/m.60796 type:complete len:249 (-) Transcript_26391:1058-1804(-)
MIEAERHARGDVRPSHRELVQHLSQFPAKVRSKILGPRRAGAPLGLFELAAGGELGPALAGDAAAFFLSREDFVFSAGQSAAFVFGRRGVEGGGQPPSPPAEHLEGTGVPHVGVVGLTVGVDPPAVVDTFRQDIGRGSVVRMQGARVEEEEGGGVHFPVQETRFQMCPVPGHVTGHGVDETPTTSIGWEDYADGGGGVLLGIVRGTGRGRQCGSGESSGTGESGGSCRGESGRGGSGSGGSGDSSERR